MSTFKRTRHVMPSVLHGSATTGKVNAHEDVKGTWVCGYLIFYLQVSQSLESCWILNLKYVICKDFRSNNRHYFKRPHELWNQTSQNKTFNSEAYPWSWWNSIQKDEGKSSASNDNDQWWQWSVTSMIIFWQ